ncbi:hypothetical protein C8F04DRAFT_155106 [Mycena alexandri]|uniref:RPN1 N-terminal domain-containing protein n=1 Tax=Mycena alexandri TaxID=1745969 RepID=A0AAD6SAW4_9AGAR|nr:hypothetical protein C8F04DRAFT_155106 [Mycena alexandri]
MSTSSMTSVPKSLKFLRPLYPDLQALYETWPGSEDKDFPFCRHSVRPRHDLHGHATPRHPALSVAVGVSSASGLTPSRPGHLGSRIRPPPSRRAR